MNDDGGPSFWWRDRKVKAMQERLGRMSQSEAIRREIVETARSESPDVLDRMQRFIDRSRVEHLENAEQVLDGFAATEEWLRRRDLCAIYVAGLLLAGLVAALFVELSLSFWHVVLIVATVVIGVRALAGWLRRESGYLGVTELRRVRPERAAR